MNGLRCPKCELVNLLTAENCLRCGSSFSNLPSTAEVSVPAQELFEARSFSSDNPNPFHRDNELGRKTYFWYRVYCAVLVAIYLFLMGIGILLVFFQPESGANSPEENLIVGLVYAILGLVFAVIFLVAIFLPRKPFNWIVGIVMIAIGMTSCCFLPATVPLLIFWLKPETKAFFGRNNSL
jgi:hypothetical protein